MSQKISGKNIRISRGDPVAFTCLTTGEVIAEIGEQFIFMVKENITDADADAIITDTVTAIEDGKIPVYIPSSVTIEKDSGFYYWSIKQYKTGIEYILLPDSVDNDAYPKFRIMETLVTETLVGELTQEEIDALVASSIVSVNNSVGAIISEVEGGITLGGATEWGEIEGTLSAQADLQSELDLKVDKVAGKGLSTNDYTDSEKDDVAESKAHITADGSSHTFIDQDVTTEGTPEFDSVTFDPTYVVTGSETVGTRYWNSDEETTELVRTGGKILQDGKEVFGTGKNVSGDVIANGQPVSITSAAGQWTAITTVNITDPRAYAFIGLATEEIADNAFGDYTLQGKVNDINTLHLDEGKSVYVGTDGLTTSDFPTTPNYVVVVGICDYSHVSQGRITLATKVLPRLEDLSDVNGTPLDTSGQIMSWDQSNMYFDADKNINDYIPKTQNDITKGPTGFEPPEDVIITGDSGTRTITLSGTFNAYYRGELNTTIVNGYTSPAHGTVESSYFLIYDGSTIEWLTPTEYQSINLFTNLLICLAWDTGTTWVYQRECHGDMPWQSHKELHEVVGTYKTSGGIIGDFVLDSSTASDRRPSVTAAVVEDEDLPTTNALLTAGGLYTTFNLVSTGIANFSVDQADIAILNGNQPWYNEWTGSAWGQTLLGNNQYMSLWLIAIPMASDTTSQKHRYIWVQGQTSNLTLSGELAVTPNSVSLGDLTLLTPELVFIGRVVIRYQGGNWKFIEVESIDGTKHSQTTSPVGNYLSVVSSDATLTGDGTTGNVLGIDLANANAYTATQTFSGINMGTQLTDDILISTDTESTSDTALVTAGYVNTIVGSINDALDVINAEVI